MRKAANTLGLENSSGTDDIVNNIEQVTQSMQRWSWSEGAGCQMACREGSWFAMRLRCGYLAEVVNLIWLPWLCLNQRTEKKKVLGSFELSRIQIDYCNKYLEQMT